MGAAGSETASAAPVGALPSSFELRRVRFEGATRLPAAELEALAAPFLNRPLRPLDLEELRQRVTRAYVERGHVNSGALLAADALQGDTLVLRIVEGRITRIRQSGLQGLDERYLAARLVREGEVLDVNRLQERFQLQLADPLFARLNVRLMPDGAAGAGDGAANETSGGDALTAGLGRAVLDIEATRARPWQLAVFAHNHVAPAVGSFQGGLDLVWRDLVGWGDTFAFVTAVGEASHQVDASWLLPLGAGRTTLGLRVAHGLSSVVEEPVAVLDIESRVDTREATLSQPLLDEPRRRLALGLTYSWRRNRTSLLGVPFGFVPGEPEGGVRVEAWRLFQEATLRRDADVYALRASVLEGRNNLVPEPLLPEQPPRRYRVWQVQGQASIASGGAAAIDVVPAQDSADGPAGSSGSSGVFGVSGSSGPLGLFGAPGPIVLRMLVQRSPDRLVPLERLAVGGRHTVRGYRENQLVRDSGWAAALEWHRPLWHDPLRGARLTLVPLVDAGAAWNHGEAKSRLASAGLGLLWTQPEFDGELFLAKRLERRDNPTRADLQDHGIHFMLRWRPTP